MDDQPIDELVSWAQAEGLQLTGESGLLQQLTKLLLESALEGEITDHLGYDKHEPAGKDGGNSRNGKRSKTVLTGVDEGLAVASHSGQSEFLRTSTKSVGRRPGT